VRKRDCRYASRNNPFAALSIRFEGFNARPACDTKVLVVVTVRRFHTASTHSSRPIFAAGTAFHDPISVIARYQSRVARKVKGLTVPQIKL
jgi:hypothetical protein